jgi:hypothetical protein
MRMAGVSDSFGPFGAGWTKEDVEAVILANEPADLLHVPILVGLNPPEAAWAQSVCVRLATHADPNVRGNAMLAFGHLARITGDLDRSIVRPLLKAGLSDPDAYVREQADAGWSDVQFFLKWR